MFVPTSEQFDRVQNHFGESTTFHRRAGISHDPKGETWCYLLIGSKELEESLKTPEIKDHSCDLSLHCIEFLEPFMSCTLSRSFHLPRYYCAFDVSFVSIFSEFVCASLISAER